MTKPKRRIMVLCGGKFALPALQRLAFEGVLCAVGIGQGEPLLVRSLRQECANKNLPFRTFVNKKALSELVEWVEEVNPDHVFTITFPLLIPLMALQRFPDRFINFHPGPLPQYRGPMPIFEVLRHQEKVTAVSVHYMDEHADEGDLLFADPVKIKPNETYGELTIRLSEHTAQTTSNLVNMLDFGTVLPRKPQDESLACYYEKPTLTDTTIQWQEQTADEIQALINACNPWHNGAGTQLWEKQVQIIAATIVTQQHQEAPGTVITHLDGTLHIACLDNQWVAVNILRTDEGIMETKVFIKKFKKQPDVVWASNQTG